ncbi:MAG: hypothetical protein HY680_00400 [Chloroflexi bacterium]|nr:hypothetical protein [Chloroflexota bacterium]
MTDRIFSWLLDALAATAMETLVVGGALLVFGLALYCLERRAFAVMSRAFGVTATVLATGWIGTTVHELSHAALCLVFRHKITGFSLFSPDTETGVLGYVRHTWDRKSLYQNLGLLFIGLAPLAVGSALLIGLGYLLVQGFGGVLELATAMPGLDNASDAAQYASWLASMVGETFAVLFAPGQLGRWQLWAFLYVSLSVGSHLSPSPADLKGAWPGLALALAALLLANGALAALGHRPLDLLYASGRWLGMGAGLMTLAVLLSGVNLMVSWVLSAVWSWLSGKGRLWPA